MFVLLLYTDEVRKDKRFAVPMEKSIKDEVKKEKLLADPMEKSINFKTKIKGLFTQNKMLHKQNNVPQSFILFTVLVIVIIRFRVQFVINLHEWVFQKAEKPLRRVQFLKNSRVQINHKLNEVV